MIEVDFKPHESFSICAVRLVPFRRSLDALLRHDIDHAPPTHRWRFM